MADITEMSLNGFDPLSENAVANATDRAVFEEATKRIVQNILKSYTGYFDIFSELIQNSLDAIDARRREDASAIGRLLVEIDIPGGRVAVTDNGIGMDERQLKYCFRPSVSFKSRRESRGHKGVGATFLGYGFTNIQIFTRQARSTIGVQLANGRAWADDANDTQTRPRLVALDCSSAPLFPDESGTRVDVTIGRGLRPDLTWWSAHTAPQWLQVLCMRTPLGGVYLSGREPPELHTTVRVINQSGDQTEVETRRASYFYPHEMVEVLPRVKDVGEIQDAVKKCDGDYSRIPADFKNLSAVWDVWVSSQLLDEENPHWERIFDEDDKRLIRLHDIAVYGCFLSTAKSWTQYQSEVLKVRRSPALVRGGMQIASDYMIQGDISVIPLTSTIGYQANTHVVIHLKDGNPDMGRKVFQPEVKAICEKISRQAVNIFKRYLHLMREDTGAPPIADSSDHFNWLMEQESFRRSNPFEFMHHGKQCAYVSVPRCEQDVVAVFHELIGMEVIRGLRFLSTSETRKYDSCYKTFYPTSELEYSKENPLGVSSASIAQRESRPFTLEYKFNLDGLIADFEKGEKFISDINCAVCWEIGKDYKERYRLVSLLVGEEGAGRTIYGATHALYLEREKRFEVICLSDILGYIRNPDEMIAGHAGDYAP